MKTPLTSWTVFVAVLLSCVLLPGCESKEHPALKLPFQDNFDRKSLGKLWSSEMMGRWRIEYDSTRKNGRLCVEQTRNNPLFLLRKLPNEVVIEVDVWAHDRIGDVKVELFTDGKFHATGYVLVHGGWKNTLSIIDRLDEHNRNCKYSELNKEVSCRRWKRGGPVQNRKYHWKIVRTGKLLKWSIDGKPFLTYHDPDPLSGKAHAYFAFSNWVSRGCFDNLKIRRYSAAKAAAPVPSRPKVVSSPSPQPVKAAVKQEVSPSPPRVEVDQDDPPPVRKARKPSLAKKRSPRTNSHAILRLRRPNTHVLPTLRAPTLQLQGKLQNRVYTIRPRPRRR